MIPPFCSFYKDDKSTISEVVVTDNLSRAKAKYEDKRLPRPTNSIRHYHELQSWLTDLDYLTLLTTFLSSTEISQATNQLISCRSTKIILIIFLIFKWNTMALNEMLTKNLLWAEWISYSAFVTLIGILVIFYSHLVPEPIKRIFKYGKAAGAHANVKKLHRLEVPKRWVRSKLLINEITNSSLSRKLSIDVLLTLSGKRHFISCSCPLSMAFSFRPITLFSVWRKQ